MTNRRKKNRKPNKRQRMQKAVTEALEEEHVLVAVFTLNGDRVNLHRYTEGFPCSDFHRAIDLLENDLRQERLKVKEDQQE